MHVTFSLLPRALLSKFIIISRVCSCPKLVVQENKRPSVRVWKASPQTRFKALGEAQIRQRFKALGEGQIRQYLPMLRIERYNCN